MSNTKLTPPDHTSGFEPTSLIDLLRSRAVRQGDDRAYTFLADGKEETSCVTYAELDLRARAIAARLQSAGATGERVLLIFPPGLDYIAAFFGCLYAKAVAVPAYPPRMNQSLERLAAIFADARPAVALTTARIFSQMEPLLPQIGHVRAVRWEINDRIHDELGLEWREPVVEGDTLAFLQYTSGSTSRPKGVMVTHQNLLHNERMIAQAFGQTSRSIIVGWLPLFHDMGLIGNVLQPLYIGAQCILMSPMTFLQRPVVWLEAVSRYGGTTSGGPNFAYELCVRKTSPEQLDALDLSSWTVAFSGAEPVYKETIDRFTDAFGPCGFRREAFYPCYGLAESTLFVTGGVRMAGPKVRKADRTSLEQNRVRDSSGRDSEVRHIVSCGTPWMEQRLRIVNPDSLTECGPSTVGEIWVSGPSIAAGYWNRPEESRRTFKAHLADSGEGPFLRTGDLGFIEDNELYIAGRLKDLIIIRGRNHYPQDIERTVEQSYEGLQPGGGAAFSVEAGSEERLVIVHEVGRRHQGENLEMALRAISQAVAEGHEIQIYAISLIRQGTIPKTSSGKIRRGATKQIFLAGQLQPLIEWKLSEPSQAIDRSPTRAETTWSAEGVQRWIASEVALRLGIKRAKIDVNEPVSCYGLDSLMDIELVHSVEVNLGVSIPVSSFLQDTTIAELAADLLARMNEFDGAPRLLASSAKRPNEFPLSHGQRALWFLHHLAPESAAYNVGVAARVLGSLDIDVMRRTFEVLSDRHPSLRAAFKLHAEAPTQVIYNEINVPFDCVDACNWSEEELRQKVQQELERPFDLESGPAFRVKVFVTCGREHVLLLAAHHIVIDLWSLAVLADELRVIHEAQISGAAANLPPLPLSYGDYVRWQLDALSGSPGEELWSYWQAELSGELPALELATDYGRPPLQTYVGAAESFRISRELTEGLSSVARSSRATLFIVLLAAYQALLHKYSGQTDLLIGCPTTGRTHSSLEPLVGYFVNPVVVRGRPSAEKTFVSFLGEVRRTVLQVFKHQQYPFPLLVDRLNAERDPSRSPIFQAAFGFQRVPRFGDDSVTAFALGNEGARIRVGPLMLEAIKLDHQWSHFDLALTMAETDGGLAGSLRYNTDLFEPSTARRIASHFARMLERIAADSALTLSEIDVLTCSQRFQLLVEWNDTDAGYGELNLRDLIELQASRTPDAVAVVCGESHLSYNGLNRRANRLARYLAGKGVGPEQKVVLCLERGLVMVEALLGVVKAGAAYVPIDTGQPAERVEYMIEDSGAVIVLTQREVSGRLPRCKAEVVCIDAESPDIRRRSDENVTVRIATENLAYVIYTSGSTGKPKGVAVEHRNIANYSVGMSRMLVAAPGATYAMVSTLAADLGNTVLFPSLISGGCLHVIPGDKALDAEALAQYFKDNRIGYLKIVPSHLAGLHASGGEDIMPARALILGGEAASALWIEELRERWPRCAFINHYGPTETTVGALTHKVRGGRGAWKGGESTPLGRPISNAGIHILDPCQNPAPPGAPGELYIGGEGVSRGYLDRPDATAERFVPDAFARQAGGRLYRTGDLARYGADGVVEFLGRKDHQVKIRGFRVELGEIEAVLRQHPGVRKAAVLARQDKAGVRWLVAYVEAPQNASVSVEELRDFLNRRLPDYMTPSGFIILDSLPLMLNGKIDRRALYAANPCAPVEATALTEGRTEVERDLTRIWRRVLGLDRVGIHDNFFKLGGDSILSIQIVSRAREAGYRLMAKDVLRCQTIADLAAVVERDTAKTAEQGLVTGNLPLTPIQHRFFEQGFADAFHYNQSVSLQSRRHLDAGLLEAVARHILLHHDALRLRFAWEGSQWRQACVGSGDAVPFAQIDISTLSQANRDAALERAAAEIQASLDLSKGPLMRMALFKLGSEMADRLLITVHHLAIDAVSWRVLLEDIQVVYQQLCEGKAVELPAKTASYREWARRLTDYAASPDLAGEMDYWLAGYDGAFGSLPVDHVGGLNCEASARSVLMSLDEEETDILLREVPEAYPARIEDLLLTALAQSLAHWMGSRKVLVDVEGHGREEIFAGMDLSRTVGWFTAVFPISLDTDWADGPAVLRQVKEHVRAVPQRGLGFGILRYLRSDLEQLEKLRLSPRAQVSFNYLGQFDQVLSGSSLFETAVQSSGLHASPRALRSYLLDVTGRVTDRRLEISWRYSANIHRRETVERLARGFMEALRSLIAHCLGSEAGGYTPSDFPEARLSQKELDDLIARFGQPAE